MKTRKTIMLMVSVVIGFFLLVYIYSRLNFAWRIHNLQKMDHQALVTECQGLISAYQSQLLNTRQVGVNYESIPPVIKKLKPKYVLVRKDHVFICVSVIPRLYVLGFAKGTIGFGQDRLCDGLWWTPHPGDDEEQYLKRGS